MSRSLVLLQFPIPSAECLVVLAGRAVQFGIAIQHMSVMVQIAGGLAQNTAKKVSLQGSVRPVRRPQSRPVRVPICS